MALDFPASPSINQKHTEGGVTWTWDGTTWRVLGKFQSSTSLAESDPVFAASPAANIVLQNIVHWNDAYNWGDHATAGYLTSASLAGLTDVSINDQFALPLADGQFLQYSSVNGKWNNVDGISTNVGIWAGGGIQIEKLGGSYLNGILSFVGGAGISIYGNGPGPWPNPTGTAGQVITADGNGGIEWSNASITETDPVFTASPASGITAANIANWNTAYNWGNHTFPNYIADSDFTTTGLMKRGATSGSYSVVTDNSSNWNTAFGWGNHASAGYITGISNLSIDALNDVAITSPASGQVLSYNSSTGLWVNSAPAGAPAGGLNTEVQFNDNGVLSGDSGFTYSKSAKVLYVSSINTNRVIESALLKSDSLSGSNDATVYLQNNAVYYYTTNASGDWTVDVRNSSSISTLQQLIGIGDSLTFVILATQGSTAYRNTTFKIDNSVVVPKWSGGTAFPGGNANSIDVYTYTIIRTGNNATIQWTVLASRDKFT